MSIEVDTDWCLEDELWKQSPFVKSCLGTFESESSSSSTSDLQPTQLCDAIIELSSDSCEEDEVATVNKKVVTNSLYLNDDLMTMSSTSATFTNEYNPHSITEQIRECMGPPITNEVIVNMLKSHVQDTSSSYNSTSEDFDTTDSDYSISYVRVPPKQNIRNLKPFSKPSRRTHRSGHRRFQININDSSEFPSLNCK